MITVYIRAVKTDIPVLSADRIPDLMRTIKTYGHLIPPIFILVGLLLSGWSLMRAAFWSIVILLVLATARKVSRMSIRDIIDALGDAAHKAMPVAVACGAAGIMYGVISLTGLGVRISSLLLAVAGGNAILVLIFSMLTGILLGFAMPPTAAYIILAALIVPSMTDVGFPLLVAHMFLFFFCCIGPITPPVALAAYSAAGIAGSDPNRTGFAAFRLGMAAYIIPFLFAFSPPLLILDAQWSSIIGETIRAMIGLLTLAVAFEGFIFKRVHRAVRLLLCAVAFAILYHNVYLTALGVIVLLVLAGVLYIRRRD